MVRARSPAHLGIRVPLSSLNRSPARSDQSKETVRAMADSVRIKIPLAGSKWMDPDAKITANARSAGRASAAGLFGPHHRSLDGRGAPPVHHAGHQGARIRKAAPR